jgi:hypothetical protein
MDPKVQPGKLRIIEMRIVLNCSQLREDPQCARALFIYFLELVAVLGLRRHTTLNPRRPEPTGQTWLLNPFRKYSGEYRELHNLHAAFASLRSIELDTDYDTARDK